MLRIATAALLALLPSLASGQQGPSPGNITTPLATDFVPLYGRGTNGPLFGLVGQIPPSIASPVILTPPNWATLNNLYQGVLYSLGGLPVASMDAHNAGAIAMTQALVGAVDVPGTPNASNTFQNDGIAGYARTALPNAPAVAAFGGGMANVAGAMVWGFNSICTNANQIEPLTQTGFTNVTCYGAEFDVNILKLPGGGTPTGNVRGMAIFGGSEVKPSGGAYGIEIGSLSQTYASTVAWDAALVIDEAPNTIGIAVGAKGTGTTSLPSQNLVFNAYSSGSALLQADILEDDAGDFIFTPGGGGFIALENSSGIPILGVFSNYIVAYEPLEFAGSSAGTMTSQVPSSFTSYNWNYPATAGTSGYVLTSGGGTTSPMTWTQISGIYAPLAGSNTFTGVNTFSNTTAATSAMTGAIVTAGGIGAAKSSFFGDTIQIETGTQYHGFALSNASNQVVTFNGLSASNDNGNMELLSGGTGVVNFSADPGVANYINNGQGLTLGATSAAGAGNLTATGTVRANTGFNINGTAGVSQTCTVNTASPLTLIFTNGIITGGTCNS